MTGDHSTPSSLSDKDRIGYWVSGFTAGEGCFRLGWVKHSKSPDADRSGFAEFAITLRADDREALEAIRHFWGCGNITENPPPASRPDAHPSASFRVTRRSDLVRFVIPHFERYTMFGAKKERDFVIWRAGVHLLRTIAKRRCKGPKRTTWTDRDKKDFQALIDAIQATRVFSDTKPPKLDLGIMGRDEPDQPLLNFGL